MKITTVAELIEILSKLKPNARILYMNDEFDIGSSIREGVVSARACRGAFNEAAYAPRFGHDGHARQADDRDSVVILL